MNKQELINHCKTLKKDKNRFINCIDVDRIINTIKQLDEPQKVTIPQFVADYIEFKKANDFHVYGAMRVIEDHYDKRVPEWFYEGNIEKFVRAWLDGYTVEEEKKYKITLLNRNDGDLYLVNQNADLADKYGHFSPVVLLLTKCTNFSKKCYELTKKEVVSYDFGWVFDCPGIKIEEVE